MPTTYKLTDENRRTHGGMEWCEDKTNRATGDPAQGLCSPGYVHGYTDPLLAVAMNPLHANFDPATMRLARCEAGGYHKSDHGLKEGYEWMRVVEWLPVPTIERDALTRWAIYCAREVEPPESEWHDWAAKWLSGEDRSTNSARAAAWEVGAAWAAWAAWASGVPWAAAGAALAATLSKPLDVAALLHQAIKDEADHKANKEVEP